METQHQMLFMVQSIASHRITEHSLISANLVLDLPQLYTKPTAEELLRGLAVLSAKPATFRPSDQEADQQRLSPQGVTRYLTSIVASQLKWIEDDVLKEDVWSQASARLSERSGRTGKELVFTLVRCEGKPADRPKALPALDRIFTVKGLPDEVEIRLHEPTITEDNLGFKTWTASYLLAQRLAKFHPIQSEPRPAKVLELGSGTGLLGIAAACVWGASVHLSDLPQIMPNLEHNIKLNQTSISQNGGSATSGALDWSLSPSEPLSDDRRFPIIIAADALYSPEHPPMLVQTIGRWLSKEARSRVIVELPLRDGYSTEVRDFRRLMLALGLEICNDGEEVGSDDWEDQYGHHQEVRCWWSVWRWTNV